VKKLVAVIVATTAILMFAPTAYASDGDLDTTWGGDGVVVSTHTDASAAYAIANYPDNRVLVVGSVVDSPASRILVSRFLADGTADTTCNGTGEFVDTVNDAVASDVVVLSDGSFVVAGTMQINNKGALFVAKFTNTCDIAKAALARSSVTYKSEPMPAGTKATVMVGSQELQAGSPTFAADLAKAVTAAGYPAASNPSVIKLDGFLSVFGSMQALTLIGILTYLVILVTMVYGPIAAALVELFPTRIRYTSMSLPYHIGNGWFGGLLPATSFAMVAQTGDIYFGLWYPIVIALGTFIIGLLFVPETKDRDIYDIR
jgi:hypothetical protein